MSDALKDLIRPDSITVSVSQEKEVAADRADIFVVVTGSSLFGGKEALQKAREVAGLVGGLKQIGVSEEHIFLQNVHAQVAGGALLKSSQATYSLRIHCPDIAGLVDIIGVITAQKNANLKRIEWKYPDDAAMRNTWLQDCIAEALQKARIIAGALGVRVIGVLTFRDGYTDGELTGSLMVAQGMPRARAAGRVTQEDLGLEISHSKAVEMSVEVTFRVSERVPESA